MKNGRDDFPQPEKGRFAFYHIIEGAVVHAIDGDFNTILGRKHNNRYIRVKILDFSEGFQAIHGIFNDAIQMIIQDNHIRVVRQTVHARFSGRVGFYGKIGVLEEVYFQQFQINRIIIHKE
jgi:hypothetical protein